MDNFLYGQVLTQEYLTEQLWILFFLVYINDLVDGLSSNARLFADDISLFSVIHDVDISVKELNNDLQQINK